MADNLAQKPENKPKPIEIGITMPTQAYFLSGIRDFTLNLIKNMTNFSEQWAYRFQSIVDELCNNAIEHGSQPGEIIKIIFVNDPQNYIQISVEDTGTKQPHIKADEIRQMVEDRRKDTSFSRVIRGRGLPKIVAEWTDELHFADSTTGGVTVTVKKYLNDPKMTAKSAQGLDNLTHIVLN
jgi:anti-sigma regulatory factor (Ser/Thr protein kinase)